ncbi:MarR family transcriptional regulator [Actinospica durhamensis]|uniref:MarR family transcriptional regulator n=2 Tax=Actinospica durhamensis TaxID=1508375 RepID=A0A941ES54_9ACTN|nr:MarR family transcriptional regulator [Actinospica durhamensis]
MSLTSVSTLSTLNRTGPRRITELAASEGVTQPSVTALVASLVRDGFVERLSDPADRRVVMVAITKEGEAYLRDRRAASTEIFAEAVEKLSAEEAATLTAALPVVERLRDVVDELRSLRQGQAREKRQSEPDA